jgi:hypothetical protein
LKEEDKKKTKKKSTKVWTKSKIPKQSDRHENDLRKIKGAKYT